MKNGADPVAHLKQKPLKKHMLCEPSFRSRMYVGKRCRSHGASPVDAIVCEWRACSPSCAEYSKLKLKPGGPPALRSPEHSAGLPGLSAEQMSRVQDSYIMLYRCTQLLQATYAAGGHGHLEQPPTASWEEDCTQQWIQGAACCCVHLVAFCSSFPPLQILGCICDRNSLENIMGKKDASGCYVSRLIAEYPLKLAESFANIAASLIDSNSKDLFPKRWHHFL